MGTARLGGPEGVAGQALPRQGPPHLQFDRVEVTLFRNGADDYVGGEKGGEV